MVSDSYGHMYLVIVRLGNRLLMDVVVDQVPVVLPLVNELENEHGCEVVSGDDQLEVSASGAEEVNECYLNGVESE